jgi:hypothetical protein
MERCSSNPAVQLESSGAARIQRCSSNPAVQLESSGAARIQRCSSDLAAQRPIRVRALGRLSTHGRRMGLATGSAWLPSRLGGGRQKRAARGLHPLLQPAHPRRHLCTTTHSRCPHSQPPLQSLQSGSSATRHNCRKTTAPYRPAVFAHHPRELPAEKLPTASETTTHAKEVCRKPRESFRLRPACIPQK